MPTSIIHLPNSQSITVTPVFGGFNFKSNNLNLHNSAFPPGWTIVLQTKNEDQDVDVAADAGQDDKSKPVVSKKHAYRRFISPTLNRDSLFISSISNPSSSDFKPASSPTRQIAMMLWTTLLWYFHLPEPDLHLLTESSTSTPAPGRPRGQWKVFVNRDGIFKGKNLLPKLERMGLIASEESCVGLDPDDVTGEAWSHMFVSRVSFWGLDPRIYLFTLSPNAQPSPQSSVSPNHSRPSSPSPARDQIVVTQDSQFDTPKSPLPWSYSVVSVNDAPNASLDTKSATPPFISGSPLPTYFPPPPPQYTFSHDFVRHPVRPKPPRQGETFYCRWIPSLNQYLSFRVASLRRPSLSHSPHFSNASSTSASSHHSTQSTASIVSVMPPAPTNVPAPQSDVELLFKWMNNPRINYAWGEAGPIAHQEEFLKSGLSDTHSFPVIGCWDGKPFGYFELYWVKEDRLAKYLGGAVDDYDRGIHCLIGEEEYRGSHRVKVWLSSLVHYCWLADSRTFSVMLEPRIDNEKFHSYLHQAGFYKEREISFPHKQAAVMKIRRDAWEAPAL